MRMGMIWLDIDGPLAWKNEELLCATVHTLFTSEH